MDIGVDTKNLEKYKIRRTTDYEKNKPTIELDLVFKSKNIERFSSKQPKTSNWVSSNVYGNQKRCIEPLKYSCNPDIDPFKYLIPIIKHLEGTEIITLDDNYMHVTFTTKYFKFVDDVEFSINDREFHKYIHVRSVSRKGKYDFGTNRKRVEKIREMFYFSINCWDC